MQNWSSKYDPSKYETAGTYSNRAARAARSSLDEKDLVKAAEKTSEKTTSSTNNAEKDKIKDEKDYKTVSFCFRQIEHFIVFVFRFRLCV